jgi:disulfide oxidoreductase YuzD
MQNNFIEKINDEKYFYSLIKDIEKMKVGFYSVGYILHH